MLAIFLACPVPLLVVNEERWSDSLRRRHNNRQVCRRPAINLFQILSGGDAANRANAAGRNRVKRMRLLAKAHQKVTSTGELFLRALAIENDLSRRVLKEPGSKTLLKEKHKHERLITQLAREYKNAIGEYLAAIRAVSSY
jgi:hypothetical protein